MADPHRAWLRYGALALLLAVLLGGCGFQLRGSESWPAALARLHVGGPELRADFARVLRPALRARGATLVGADEHPTARLEVLAFNEERRLLSAAAGSDLREYELWVSVRYRIVPAGTAAGDAVERRVVARRDYLHRPSEVTAALTEERRLRAALLDEAAAALARQLALAG
jgi:LPS-assembly lipoprotein